VGGEIKWVGGDSAALVDERIMRGDERNIKHEPKRDPRYIENRQTNPYVTVMLEGIASYCLPRSGETVSINPRYPCKPYRYAKFPSMHVPCSPVAHMVDIRQV
jgi:hypothetical protein